MNQQQVNAQAMVRSMLECSVYAAPTDPGLTIPEIREAAGRLGLLPGEVTDALNSDMVVHGPAGRFLPHPGHVLAWMISGRHDPEFRNLEAYDLVHAAFTEAVRSAGLAAARLDRTVLVERGAATGMRRHDLQVVLTILVMQGRLVEDGGTLRMSPQYAGRISPKAEREQFPRSEVRTDERRRRVHPVVVDVVARRADGRRLHVEPLDAFGEELDRLGHGHFRLWWGQMVAEVRQGDPQTTPVSVTVLCAALVEGVLTFVVRHGRALGIGPFGSSTFDGRPRGWSIDDLVRSAASGGPGAILDQGTRARAETLIRARQRIHAGRMLEDHPTGVPDQRPDEAREARATAEVVVRRVLDWLEAHSTI